MKRFYTLMTCLLLSFSLSAQTMWINEIHYDNKGADVNEGVEIAGRAGTDLDGWKLVSYNGNNGASYSSSNLEGTISDQMNGYGTVWIPIDGLQNGAPDGIALIDPSSTVIQFLSYEGSFKATNGDALDKISTDIGIAQTSSAPVGSSLQLQGSGSAYNNFTWAVNIEATRGSPNNGQIFEKDLNPPFWTTGYPRAGKMADNKGELLLNMDEPGRAYYIVMADGASAPTSEEVKAGQNYGTETVLIRGSMVIDKGDTEYMALVSGADPETTYNIYVVAEDNMATPNLQTAPVMINATTTAPRTLVITSPVATGIYYAGSDVTFSWTTTNITNVIIGGYDHDCSEEFFITDDNDEPCIIDATLGQFIFTMPNGPGTNLVDIRIYDADDLTFFETVTPVNLMDEIDPSINEMYPPNGGVYIPVEVEIFAFFDEDIYPGTGNIVLKKMEDNSVVESFDITTASPGGAIEMTDEILILKPTADLEEGTIYYIEMDAGVVIDYDDNPFAGITGSETWSFKSFTEPAPLFMDEFNDGDLAPWTTVSISGDTKEWELYQETARLHGYNSGDIEEDWLISPPVNGTGHEDLFVLFDLWYSHGVIDDNNYLKLYYSTDYDGNSANLTTATWMELDFEIPAVSSITMPSGIVTINPSSFPVYFAFEYNYEPDNYREWRVDNFLVGGSLLPASDATLSDLIVDGTTIDGFTPDAISYTMILPAGTTTVPKVSWVTSDNLATAVIMGATDMSGDVAARTTTVKVTAADGTTTKTYSIQFDPIVELTNLSSLRKVSDYERVYRVTNEVVVTALDSYKGQIFIEDATAAILIFDEEGVIIPSYNQGDGITGLTGTLKDHNDMLEFIPFSNPGTPSSTGNTTDPKIVTLTEFITNFENYEAELITIQSVSFTDANGTATFANDHNYTFTIDEDEAILRVLFYNTSVTGVVIPYMADITGPALWDYSSPKIIPRNVRDINIYSSVSTLNDLLVDGTSVDNFDAATLAYTVTMATETTTVPTVTATTTEENALVTITQVANITGTETERTSTIEVVSHDQASTTTYTIILEVSTSVDKVLSNKVNIYPVPVQYELTIENISEFQSLEITDMAGSRILLIKIKGQHDYRIDVSFLPKGIYFLTLRTENGVITRKFIRE